MKQKNEHVRITITRDGLIVNMEDLHRTEGYRRNVLAARELSRLLAEQRQQARKEQEANGV